MHEPLFTKKMAKGGFAFKFEKYWQSVLRVGLPFAILVYGGNYVAFRFAGGAIGMHYPWVSQIISAVFAMFLFSTIWWLLMREIAAWKRKNRE